MPLSNKNGDEASRSQCSHLEKKKQKEEQEEVSMTITISISTSTHPYNPDYLAFLKQDTKHNTAQQY